MLLASAARDITRRNIEDYIKKEINILEEQIKKAATKGTFSIINDGYLQPESIQILKSLGYKIKFGIQHDQHEIPYYEIFW